MNVGSIVETASESGNKMNRAAGIIYTFRIFALVFIGALAAGVAHPGLQGASVAINSSVDKNHITIGDLIRYSVKITRDSDLVVELPGLAANLGEFEIRDYAVHETRTYNSFSVDSIDYIITTFDTGNYVIPRISMTILKADSSRDTLSTDPISIRVESVMKGEARDIRDIKPPLSIERDWTPYFLYGALGAAALLLAAAGYWYYRRKKTGQEVPVRKIPIRPAHETALEALEELTGSPLLAKGEIKEYHIRISDILRRYIDERYFIPALEMTTDQTIAALRQHGEPESLLELLEEFLNGCDLVKFAKASPSSETIAHTTESAFEYVNRTRWMFREREGVPPEQEAEPNTAAAGSNPDKPNGELGNLERQEA